MGNNPLTDEMWAKRRAEIDALKKQGYSIAQAVALVDQKTKVPAAKKQRNPG